MGDRRLQNDVMRSFATYASKEGRHFRTPAEFKHVLTQFPILREGFIRYLRDVEVMMFDIDVALLIMEHAYRRLPRAKSYPEYSRQPASQLNSRFTPVLFQDLKQIVSKVIVGATIPEQRDKYYMASLFAFAYAMQKGNVACTKLKWSDIRAVETVDVGRIRLQMADDDNKPFAIEGRNAIDEQNLGEFTCFDILVHMLNRYWGYVSYKRGEHAILHLNDSPDLMSRQIWDRTPQHHTNAINKVWEALGRHATVAISFNSLKAGGIQDNTIVG